MSEKESAGLREALAELAAKWRKRVEPLRNLGESNQIVCGWVEECAYELEAALAPAISRCDVYTELCKPQTDIKFRLECVRELGHKEPHAYEFPPAISRPPTQGAH